MRVWTTALVVAASVAACTTNAPPERLVFGVSGDRVAVASTPEADAETRRFLDWKVNKICTLGYDTVKVETLAAEENRQIVNENVRCSPYTHVSPF